MNDTIAMRPGEELDTSRLEPYLRAVLPETEGPLAVRQFGGGHANLTYLLRFGECEYVLRRPPFGPLPAGGHDMKREYRVLAHLYRGYALAPRAFVLCTDAEILGADFVVMERRRGIVIRETLPPQLAGDPSACLRLSENLVRALAALHGVDYAALGLADLGRPEGYLERQLTGWMRRWEAAQTEAEPSEPARRLAAWLLEHRPASGAPALVHNDFKLDNAIVAAEDPTRFVAILDWDMSTLGDPLVDLGNVLALWREATDPLPWYAGAMPTAGPGFMSRRQLVERYAEATHRDVAAIGWYHAFNLFRYAAIALQIYARYARGQTQDPRFAHFDARAEGLIRNGLELVRHL